MHERSAIEALRAGVPNSAAIRLLGTNEAALLDRFARRLHERRERMPASSEDRRGLVVAGGFGAGKSHLLGYLQEHALEERFVVSLVSISKETPLFDVAKVYAAAIRNAVVPGRNDDVMTVAISAAIRRSAAWDDLDRWASSPASGLSPIFAALLYLLPRPSAEPEQVAAIARFLGGARLGISQIRQWLRAAGAAKLFELRPVKETDLALQRLRFLPRLLAAAGYSGWCVLLDEVELIGRYGPVQRGRAYAELARWLGLGESGDVPDLVAVCAISEDFTDIVINNRRDDELVPPRLEARGLLDMARHARTGMRALEKDQYRLAPPDEAVLRQSLERVSALYRRAYDWTPPATVTGERLTGKTMRQYIKSWVTSWDIERLYGETGGIVTETVPVNYTASPDIEKAPPEEPDYDAAS